MKSLLFLFALVFGIAVTNFTAGTYLTGWDNLHPEFNFPLNIYRSLFASWQEYQGLGLAAGTGYASDLPRQIFLWLLSFVFPNNMLRYVYHFLMLLVGALGVYTLLKNYILTRFDLTLRERASLVGGILYIFNLGTVQMFYPPFEAYSNHFAALPWLVYTFLRFLDRGDKKSLLYLFFGNVLAIPQGYVATYFLVTTMVLGIVMLIHVFKTKQIKRIFIALSIVFIANAFWLLPNMYFLVTKSQVPIEAKINQMSTEDDFLKNKKFGDLANSALLKGFWFDNVDRNKNGSMTYQMKDWMFHLNNRVIVADGYLLFTIALLGMIFAWRKKFSEAAPFIPVFFLSFVILSNNTPVFSQSADIFYKVPLFSQIFRFPFTKFAITAAFSLAIFYAVAFFALSQMIKQKIVQTIIFLLFLTLPIIFVYPVFFGKFIDTRNKVAIPKAYSEVFEFFQKQEKNTRIANFPQYTFWGWSFYNWGYRGSGILWYGIEQPIMDRAFDVWSKENENYHHEMLYAVYSGNKTLFEKLLEKYQVTWIVVDDNIMSYNSQREIYFAKLKEFVTTSPKIKLYKTYSNIYVYKVDLDSNPNNFVFLANNLPSISKSYSWNNYDTAYIEYGNYTSSEDDPDIYYPFRTLFTGKDQKDLEFTVEDKGSYFSFQTKIPKSLVNATLMLPQIFKEEITELDKNNSEDQIVRYPQIFLDGELILNEISQVTLPYIREGNLEVRIQKINGYYHYDTTEDVFRHIRTSTCNPFNKGEYKHEEGEETLRLISIGSSNCLDYDFPSLSHRLGYLVTVESKHTEGKSLLFAIINKQSEHGDIETYLPKTKQKSTSYVVIPPMDPFGIGYTAHIDNISIGRVKTVNELGTITIHPIPYRFLTSLKIVNPSILFRVEKTSVSKPLQTTLEVDHPNPTYYTIKLNNETIEQLNNGTLILSQSYDNGWKAYQTQNFLSRALPFLFGKELKDHILVNNWENGWTLNNTTMQQLNNKTIVLIYLPQYLEYLGFILLFGLLVRIALWKVEIFSFWSFFNLGDRNLFILSMRSRMPGDGK